MRVHLFEDRVETASKAATSNIMSIERLVNELWGDSLTQKEKDEEVEKIKILRGINVLEEEPEEIHDLEGESDEEEPEEIEE